MVKYVVYLARTRLESLQDCDVGENGDYRDYNKFMQGQEWPQHA
jgi:hypothetical protein